MSLVANTLDLWRRAPAWRYTLVGAVVATVLASFIGGGSPSGGTSTTATGNQVGQTNNPPAQQPQQCGPQGQVSLQAPIVLSSSGQVPGNVAMQGGQTGASGVSAQVQARFVQFSTLVDAASREPRTGERCVKMHGALDKLQAADYAYADCFQDGKNKLVAAQACSSDLANSDARFERLKAAYDASRANSSAEQVQELARARERLTPFDENRERWNSSDTLVEAGEHARKVIAESDARIQALRQAGGRTGSDLADLQALSGAAGLSALDRARLSVADRAILERAEQAKETLGLSDRRLRRLEDSMAADLTSNQESRTQLIAALSALTALDLQRASATQQQAIEQARTTAAQYAVNDLVASTANLDLDSASPASYQRLRELMMAVKQYGGVVEPGSQAEQAMVLAQRADASLVRSDRRIVDMHAVVKRVAQGGPAELGADVLRTHEALTDFDRKRMTDDDQQAYSRLESAREVTLATRRQQLNLSVPLFVTSAQDDADTAGALDSFRQGLSEAGFNLVPAEEQSAVTLSLRRSTFTEKQVKFSGSTLNTVEVVISVTGKWTFGDKSLSIEPTKGDAAGYAGSSLKAEAVNEAVEAMVKRLVSLTDA